MKGKKMETIKNTLKDKKFWLCSLITIVFFGFFCKLQFATDTYAVFLTEPKEMITHFFASGRFITAIMHTIVTVLNVNQQLYYMASFGLALLCTALAIYRLYRVWEEDTKHSNLAMVAAVLVIINVFSIELFLYIEKGIMMLSVLFCVLAFEQMRKFFLGNKKSALWAGILMILANFCYQGTVALFVALCLVYLVKHAKDVKTFLINNVVTALCYGIPALLNYGIVRFIFSNERIVGSIDIAQSVAKIVQGTKQMLVTTYDILPKYFFIGILMLLTAFTMFKILTTKKEKKGKGLLCLGLVYVIVGTCFVTIFPQIMQNTASIWFVARSTYAFSSLIGLVLIYLCLQVKVDKRTEKVLLVLMIAFLGFQYVNFTKVERDHYIVNYIDQYVSNQVVDEIKDYEKESGNQITKIAFYYQDAGIQYSYPGLYTSGDTNISAWFPEWSRKNILLYHLGRNLEEISQQEDIFAQYFAGKNWSSFSKEQLVFQDDTIHICLY